MTVIMAIWDVDGSILIGGDSEQTDEHGLKSGIDKIRLTSSQEWGQAREDVSAARDSY